MAGSRFDGLARLLASGHSRRGVARWLGGAGLAAALAFLGLGESPAKHRKQRQKRRHRRNRTSSPPPPGTSCTEGSCSPVLLAAGDIASCASAGDEATAALLDGLTG